MKSWLQSLGVLILMAITFILGATLDSCMPKDSKDLRRAIERTLRSDEQIIACVSNVLAYEDCGRGARLYVVGDHKFTPFRCADTIQSNLFGVVLAEGMAYLMYWDSRAEAFGVTRIARQTNGTHLVSLSTGSRHYGVSILNDGYGHRNKYVDWRSVLVSPDGREYVVSQLWNLSTFAPED